MLTFTAERASGAVSERDFDLTVDDARVPATIWAPSDARSPRPLVLMGHGGGQHRREPALTARARRYAEAFGYAVLSIDAPDHGERADPEAAAAMKSDVADRARGGEERTAPSPIFKSMGERARRIGPEWRAALDAAQTLPFVGTGPVGYWGVSMGTVLGVPFVADEPRITCAVFGLGGVRPKDVAFAEAARRITIPVQFTFQWDDVLAPRETGLALYDAFGSTEKSMHVNPGPHGGIPEFEWRAWEAFFRRHLGAGS